MFRITNQNWMVAIALVVFVSFTLAETSNRTLVITAYNTLSELYIDGVIQPIPNGITWNTPDYVPLSPDSRLIALKATNLGNPMCGGALASVVSESLFTDSSWKCTISNEANWSSLEFNDSSWSNAVEYGDNANGHMNCSQNQDVIGISPNAKWLWTSNQFDFAIYCRGNARASLCASSPCLHGGVCYNTSDSSYICLCKPGWTGFRCESPVANRTLTITVKTILYNLYIDGDLKPQLPNFDNWTLTDEITLSPINRLIGVTAIDVSEICAGLIASVTDDFLLSDASWKCTPYNSPLWYHLGFNDSAWSSAYIVGPNHNVTFPDECQVLKGISAISPNAFWIWTNTILNTPAFDPIIYCRGYIPICERESPCRNGGICNRNNETICECLIGFVGVYCDVVDFKLLTLTANNTLYVAYVDGNQIGIRNGTDWKETDSFQVLTISRLVAVMTVQLEKSCPGILVSVTDPLGDYVVSDATWKCSACATVGWDQLGYDDSSWPAAVLQRKNEYSSDTQCEGFAEIASISSEAYWIWTDTSVTHDVTVYCRGYLPICDVHPCRHGGTCNRNAPALCTCPGGYTGIYCESALSAKEIEPVDVPAEKDVDDLEIVLNDASVTTSVPPLAAAGSKSFESGQRKAVGRDRRTGT